MNGIEEFRFNNLKEFDIIMSPDSSLYMMEMDKEHKYLGGNGTLIETDSANFLTWKTSIKKFDLNIRTHDLEKDFDYTVSMLRYWKQWKKSN